MREWHMYEMDFSITITGRVRIEAANEDDAAEYMASDIDTLAEDLREEVENHSNIPEASADWDCGGYIEEVME